MAYGKAIWERHRGVSGDNNSIFARPDLFEDLRRHAGGWQDTSKWQQKFETTKGKTGETQTSMNINWDAVAAAKKYVDILVEMLLEMDRSVVLDVLNPEAQQAKRRFKTEKLVRIRQAEFLKQFREAGGLPQDDTDMTEEELELYMAIGGYKDQMAMAMEILINQVLRDNDWDYSVIRDVVRNLAVIGIGAVINYTQSGNRIRIESVDPEHLILPYQERGDFDSKKMPYAAVLRKKTLDQLYREAGDQFTEKQYQEIKDKYFGDYLQNNDYRGRYDFDTVSKDRKQYVEVLEYYFYSIDVDKYRVRKTKDGYKVDRRDDTWTPPENNPKVQEVAQKYRQVYQGFWIPGSNFVYNAGEMPHSPRQPHEDHETCLPIHIVQGDFYRMNVRSVTSMIIQFVDIIQTCWLQIQNNLGKIIPPGIIQDTNAALGQRMGQGGNQNHAENAAQIIQTGNMYYDSIAFVELGLPNFPQRLAEFHGGQFPEAVPALMGTIAQTFQLLEAMVGFNDATNANTPDPDTLVRVQERQAQATTRAISYLVRSISRGTRSLYWSLCGQIQSIIQSGTHNFDGSAGEYTVMVINKLKDMPFMWFGIDVQVGLTESEKFEMEQYIQLSLKQRTETGVGGIELEDAMAIKELPTRKMQIAMLIARRKRRMAEDMQKQQQAQEFELAKIQQANQGQAELQQMKAKNEIDKHLAILQAKMETDMNTQDQKHMQELEQIAEKLRGEIQKAMVPAEATIEAAEIAKEGVIGVAKIKSQTDLEKERMKPEPQNS